ncbi:MAG: ABC transporter substrate-binding protein [Lactobacillales bacterium]|jgi:branched-chain amino acid transport system substrate-binding protein|nr:ABC transporter substrate-binding protein [Lactobacillales bacterium]
MKKAVLSLGIVLVVIAVVFVYKRTHTDTVPDKPVVKIGALLPLTGGMPSMGLAGHNGAQMAIDEINATSGNKYRYELIVEDVGVDIKRVVPIFNKMLTKDGISAVISFNSQVGYAIKPLAKQNKVIQIASATDFGIADGEFNFINISDVSEGIDRLLAYFDQKGYKRIAIASFNHPAAQKVIAVLKEKTKGSDFSLVDISLVNPDERQLSIEALKIVQSKPDVVFLYTFEPLTTLYAKELKQAGYQGPISSVYMLSYSDYPALFDGQVYVDDNPGKEDFRAKYKAKFGLDPNSVSPMLYNSTRIIYELFERNENPLEDVSGKIKVILDDYEGPSGKMTLKDSGRITSDSVLVEMLGGAPVVIEE